MTDQQQQKITHFKKRVNDDLNVQMELLVDQPAFLIKILNLDSLDYFQQKIDDSYLENHKQLIPYFETAKDLMMHLTLHFKELNISDRGVIKFYIKFSQAVKPKLFTLDIKKKQMDKVELVNTKVKRMEEKFQERIAEKEATIEQLRAEILKIKSSCQQSNNIVKNLLFYPYAHPQGYQNQYFSTNFTGKSIIVHHNHDGQPEDHIFVLNHEIIVGTIKSFTVKVLHNADILCFSFGTEMILSDCLFDGPEIVSYQTGGHLTSKGQCHTTDIGIGINDKFQCELNQIDFKINWIKNNHQIATTLLPQSMRNKSLYFAIIFSCDKQKVEIILN